VRIQCVTLKHHGDVAIARLALRDLGARQANRARVRELEPRDHSQQRRFPTARGAQQHDELADFGGEGHVANGLAPAEPLRHAADLERHLSLHGS